MKNLGLYEGWIHDLYQCSALPTEPNSQVEAGHFAGLKKTCGVMNKWLWKCDVHIGELWIFQSIIELSLHQWTLLKQ